MVEDKIKQYVIEDYNADEDSIKVISQKYSNKKGEETIWYECFYSKEGKEHQPHRFIKAKYLKEYTYKGKSYYTVHYECPHCWEKYKKNGEPYKNSKRIMHHHGEDTDKNQIIERCSHCATEEAEKYCGVEVIIDDDTKRIYLKKK